MPDGSTAGAAGSADLSRARVPSRAGLERARLPDVAALGDPQTGLLVGQTQTFPDGTYYDEYRPGGTSLSRPIFAGLMALADQRAGTPHGFANPLFYANPGAFYDVLSVKTAVARRNSSTVSTALQGPTIYFAHSTIIPVRQRSTPVRAGIT